MDGQAMDGRVCASPRTSGIRTPTSMSDSRRNMPGLDFQSCVTPNAKAQLQEGQIRARGAAACIPQTPCQLQRSLDDKRDDAELADVCRTRHMSCATYIQVYLRRTNQSSGSGAT